MSDSTKTEATVVSFPDGQATFVIDSGGDESTVSILVPEVKPFVLTDVHDDSFALVRQRASDDLMTWEGEGDVQWVGRISDGTVTLASVGAPNVFWTLESGDYEVRAWRDADDQVCRIAFALELDA